MSGLSLSDFVAFARATGLAVLATASPAGEPEAALMGVAVSEDGELVFDAPAGARKLANLAHNVRAAVVLGCTGDISIQVEGRARVVAEEERTNYERVYAARFPGSRVSDPAFEVVVVTPTWVRRYDTSTDPPRQDHAAWLPG